MAVKILVNLDGELEEQFLDFFENSGLKTRTEAVRMIFSSYFKKESIIVSK